MIDVGTTPEDLIQAGTGLTADQYCVIEEPVGFLRYLVQYIIIRRNVSGGKVAHNYSSLYTKSMQYHDSLFQEEVKSVYIFSFSKSGLYIFYEKESLLYVSHYKHNI